MVGIFSRFSGGRIGHRRTQSAVDVRQTLARNVEVAGPAPSSAAHGIETSVEFKPVEHPTEPIDYDQPVKCPLPEPSILNDLLQAEKQRLEYVHFFRSNDDLSLPIGFFSGYYVGEVSVGSSYEKRYLTLDTGSQLIWLQCDPCEICGKKLSPGFNPDNSTTYKSLECDHRICQQNGFYCDEDTETCKFISRYADNDSAIGFLGTDNFHVSTPTVGMSHDILDVIFGCAEEDHRQSWSISDGILGLGLGDESFTSQAKVDRFSYCIPPEPPKDTESYHKMLFGPIANLAGQTTPFRLKGGVYYLRLEGISLLSTRFSIPLIVRNGYMDMAMDSGTTSIWLHPTAYTLLSNALKDALQLTNAYEGCYFGTMKDVNWISITFQFQGGVDVKVPASGIFFESNNKVCTAIYPTQQEWIPSILGLRGQDGRLWKERMSSASGRVRGDLPVVKEGSHLEPEAGGNKPRPSTPKRAISPSLSAPEHNLISILEEWNATQDQNAGCKS